MAALYVLYILTCLFLILVVLLQAGKGDGMGAVFGGGGSGTLLGNRGAATFLSKLTVASAVLFMLLSIILAYHSSAPGSRLEQRTVDPDQVPGVGGGATGDEGATEPEGEGAEEPGATEATGPEEAEEAAPAEAEEAAPAEAEEAAPAEAEEAGPSEPSEEGGETGDVTRPPEVPEGAPPTADSPEGEAPEQPPATETPEGEAPEQPPATETPEGEEVPADSNP